MSARWDESTRWQRLRQALRAVLFRRYPEHDQVAAVDWCEAWLLGELWQEGGPREWAERAVGAWARSRNLRAPKGQTDQRSRKLSTYVAPFQEEWVRARARELFEEPEPGPGSVMRNPVSRFLRRLIEREMEREAVPQSGAERQLGVPGAAGETEASP
jgi:hypothetical protein